MPASLSHPIRRILTAMAVLALIGTTPALSRRSGSPEQLRTRAQAAGSQRLIDNYRNLPLSFEADPNGSRHKFTARGVGYALTLTGAEAALRLQSSELRLKLINANPSPLAEGLDELPGKSNYYAIRNQQVSFEIGDYDRSLPLVIDPVLSYSALIDSEFINAIAIDAEGAIYFTGLARSASFPISPGAHRSTRGEFNRSAAFVAKLNAAGTALVYSTYIGGFEAFDYPYGIAIDIRHGPGLPRPSDDQRSLSAQSWRRGL